MNTTVGKIVQQKRREKGMTQEQLAQMIGVSSAAVSKWETASANRTSCCTRLCYDACL